MKYRSKQTVCNQMHKHASKKEAGRCDELYILGKQKLISQLKQQPVFTLQPKFKLRDKTIRAITYRADFSYFDNEKRMFVVEDTKGFRTRDYVNKAKMLQFIMKDREDFLFKES